MNPIGCQDGAEIRRLRQERLRISGAALAARVGVTRQSMSNIELGNKPAGLVTLIKIARELGVPLDEIIKPKPTPIAAPRTKGARKVKVAA